MTGRKGVVTKQVQQNAGDRDTQARALSFRASQRGGVVVNGDFNWIANFIWAIADDVLRDLYVRGKYRDKFQTGYDEPLLHTMRSLHYRLDLFAPCVLSIEADRLPLFHNRWWTEKVL
jgi:hypothetical protein